MKFSIQEVLDRRKTGGGIILFTDEYVDPTKCD
jgi:hypothetical protein